MMSLGSYHEHDYYKLLEVTPDATKEEIDAAYERLKGVFDESSSATFMLFGDDEAASMRHMLEEAYQTLSDERLRERYDDSIGVAKDRRAKSSSSAAAMSNTMSVTSTTTPIMDARIVERAEAPAETKTVETPPEVRAAIDAKAAAEAKVAAETKAADAKAAADAKVAAEAKAAEAKAAEAKAAEAKAAEAKAAEAKAADAKAADAKAAADVKPEPAVEAPADVTEPPPSMVVSPPATVDANMEFSGGVLMRIRESKGISLEQIAQRTKISMTHLRAIEANQYDKLPARVYVRGFVSQYAKFLTLPQERVCESYLQIYDRFVQAKSS